MIAMRTSKQLVFLPILAICGELLIVMPLVARGAPPDFTTQIQPVVEKYCLDCHGAETAEGDLSLGEYRSIEQMRQSRGVWLKVLAQLQAESMPPEDAEQPTGKQREQLIRWVDSVVNEVDCSQPQSPGHVTLRRLNRHEYRNTIRDLLGVDYEPARDFPADDVGYGFDNIGDVMSLPPLLMEKYLTAAEQISERVIVVDAQPDQLNHRLSRAKLQGDGAASDDSSRLLFTNGEVFVEIEFPADGQYQFRTTACADQAGDEAAKMGLRIDGKEVSTFDVDAERDKAETYRRRIRLSAGKHRIGVSFLNDYYNEKHEDPQRRDRNLFIEQFEVRGPLNVQPDNLPEMHRRIFVAMPDEQLTAEQAARKILQPLASRTFRRPVTSDELTRLVRFVELADEQGDSFEKGIQLALQAMLVSPHFLFRVERDPEGEATVRDLDDYELATRLSYFLWSSMPDDELFQLAGKGRLRQGDNLQQQVRRMLGDPKSQAFIESFCGQWLQLRSSGRHDVRPAAISGLRSRTVGGHAQGDDAVLHDIVRDNLSILRMLDADFTFVNERLARHYGIDGVEGADFQRVSLAGHSPRRGTDAGQHPGRDFESDPHFAGETRQVRAGESARHSAAAAPRQRATVGR